MLFKVTVIAQLVKIFAAVSSLLTISLLTQLLGQSGFGKYAYVISLITIALLPIQMGLTPVLVKETAKIWTNNDVHGIEKLITSTRHHLTKVMCVALLIIVIFFFLYSSSTKNEYDFKLNLLVFAIPLIGYGQINSAVLRGFGKPIVGIILDVALRNVLMLMMIYAVYQQKLVDINYSNMLLIYLISCCIGLCISWAALSNELKKLRRKANKSTVKSPEAKIIKFSHLVPFAIVTGVSTFALNLDVVLIKFFQGDISTGVYKIASSVAGLVLFGLSTVNLIIQPQIVSALERKNYTRFYETFSFARKFSVFVSLIFLLIYYTFGSQILVQLFGDENHSASLPISILSTFYCLSTLFGPVQTAMLMTGKHKNAMWISIISLSFSVLGSVWLLINTQYGIAGVAFMTGFSYLFRTALFYFEIKRSFLKSSR